LELAQQEKAASAGIEATTEPYLGPLPKSSLFPSLQTMPSKAGPAPIQDQLIPATAANISAMVQVPMLYKCVRLFVQIVVNFKFYHT
jgi:hypothetical protein